MLIVECGIFGVESRNDCTVEDDRLCHGSLTTLGLSCGAKVPSNRAPVKQAYFTPTASSRSSGPMFRSELTRGRTGTSSCEGHENVDLRHLAIPSFIQPYLGNMAPPPPLHSSQTRTPIHLSGHPQKSALVAEFAGKHLRELRTPALVIDRHVFSKNCARMHANAAGYGAAFRAHLKTHKVMNRSGAVSVLSMRLLHVPYSFHSLSLDRRRDKAPTCFLCCYYSRGCRIYADGSLGSCEIGTRI